MRILIIAFGFFKIKFFGVNSAVTIFVLLDETRKILCLNYENVNIRKIPLSIFQCESRTCLPVTA
jgi:hypothetical protein